VFVPATFLVNGDPYHDNGRINKKFTKKAIDAIVQEIENQGKICLRACEGNSNYTIFFWDITHLSSNNLLQKIQDKRTSLLSGLLSRPSSIGAEPDQFAWVNIEELEHVIHRAQNKSKVNKTEGFYFVKAKELVMSGSILKHKESIKLSPGFVGLISKEAQSNFLEDSMLAIIKFLKKKYNSNC